MEKNIKFIKKKNSNFQVNAVTNLNNEDKNKFFSEIKDLIEDNHFRLFDWSPETQRKLLDDCDIVFLPIYTNRPGGMKYKYKTENRIVDALNAGKIVLTNEGVDSYYPFKTYVKWIPKDKNEKFKLKVRFSKPLGWIPLDISEKVYKYLFFKKNIRLPIMKNGYLFDIQKRVYKTDISPNDYAESLLSIIENPEPMFQKILSAQKIIDKKYLPEVVAKKWLALDI